MNQNILLGILGLLLLGSCDFNQKSPSEIEGYAPIYVSASEQFTIRSTAARDYENPGKIYKYGNYTFQMDRGNGIHVINSSDPSNPKKVKFIQVLGCTDISIKDNILYTNNFKDLISLNISDINNVTLSARNKNAFPITLDTSPPESGYFECIDNTRGVVVGWEKKILKNPKCRR